MRGWVIHRLAVDMKGLLKRTDEWQDGELSSLLKQWKKNKNKIPNAKALGMKH